jgi:signal transduction histidine kinase
MIRLWRRSLSARLILFLLLALALSQGVAVLTFWNERGVVLRAAAQSEFFSRTASLAVLLEATPDSLQSDILSVSGTNYTRFWISSGACHTPASWWKQAWGHLMEPMPDHAALYDIHEDPTLALTTAKHRQPGDLMAIHDTLQWVDLTPRMWPNSRTALYVSVDALNGMGLSLRLSNGTWLNAAYAKSNMNTPWSTQTLSFLAITALVLSLIAVLVARGIAKPLRRLADAAELLGRGELVPPVEECGTDDVRNTIDAFNRMQDRIQRFIQDRTRMLAAMGHDLRTPLTSLRLRAEFVSDPEIQAKMLTTIEEIRSMTEAAIAYAREEATVEDTRAVELSALVESLCDDLAEMGMDVTFIESSKINYRCRPDGLRRALRNLIENGIRYGERARVSLVHDADAIEITIEDDGPGIPQESLEQVFAPYFRLEDSRNRETGGVGLGLSIAREIVRHHGGDIFLRNQVKGMRVVISLPTH